MLSLRLSLSLPPSLTHSLTRSLAHSLTPLPSLTQITMKLAIAETSVGVLVGKAGVHMYIFCFIRSCITRVKSAMCC